LKPWSKQEVKKQREFKHLAYIPAFNRRFLTPFYDLMMKYAARESTFKPRLVGQARIDEGQRVLDLGCGTATLTILIKKTNPQAEVIGLDIDPEILGIAKGKVAEAGVNVRLDQGMAHQLPYPDGFFDHVFSSMVFHHLAHEDKIRALKEIIRVLKPGGEMHITDLGKPHNFFMRLPTLIIRRLEETEDNVKGLLPKLFYDAGFEHVEETTRHMTLVGTVILYKTRKPLRSTVREVKY